MKKIVLTKKHLLALIILIAGIVIDQVSKALVSFYMVPGKTYVIIPYLFNFRFITNRGAAFGMLANHRWVFLIVSSIAIVLMLIYSLFTFDKLQKIYVWGLSMTVSGGIGNMIDRTVSGEVVDFIEFAFMEFATFNGADCFICIGGALIVLGLLLDIIKEYRQKPKEN